MEGEERIERDGGGGGRGGEKSAPNVSVCQSASVYVPRKNQ